MTNTIKSFPKPSGSDLEQPRQRLRVAAFCGLFVLMGVVGIAILAVPTIAQRQAQEIGSEEEFQQVLAADRAVIFCRADWSYFSSPKSPRFQAFETVAFNWTLPTQEPEVEFFVIDHTKGAPSWATSYISPYCHSALQSGAGEAVWMRRGSIRQCGQVGITPTEFVEQTAAALGKSADQQRGR